MVVLLNDFLSLYNFNNNQIHGATFTTLLVFYSFLSVEKLNFNEKSVWKRTRNRFDFHENTKLNYIMWSGVGVELEKWAEKEASVFVYEKKKVFLLISFYCSHIRKPWKPIVCYHHHQASCMLVTLCVCLCCVACLFTDTHGNNCLKFSINWNQKTIWK